jgi:hypothetical protein
VPYLRSLSALLTSLFFVASFVGCYDFNNPVEQLAGDDGEVVLSITFEEGNLGNFADSYGFTGSSSESVDALSVAGPAPASRSLKLEDNDGTAGIELTVTTPALNGGFEVSFAVYEGDTGAQPEITLQSAGGNEALTLSLAPAAGAFANVRYSSEMVIMTATSISTDAWHTIRVTGDVGTGRYALFVDGALLASDIPFKQSVPNIKSISIETPDASTGTSYFDTLVVKRR